MATIENLPPNLLVMIFSNYVQSEGHEDFLENIPLVCKTWKKLSSDGSLWRDVKARNWKFLLHLSRRRLIYHTQSLKLLCNESFFHKNLSPVLKKIQNLKSLDMWDVNMNDDAIKFVTKHCPHLESLRWTIARPSEATLREFDQFLTVCGPTLRHLDVDFDFWKEAGQQQFLSGIAAKCPLLERLVFYLGNVPIPISDLQRGCSRLRELEFTGGSLITAGMNYSLGCGFKELKKFRAFGSDFSGTDIYSVLKDSVDLELLELSNNKNLLLNNISKIPSDKVKNLNITLEDPDKNLKALGDALKKWRRTLLVLDLSGWNYNISFLHCLLRDNPRPPLESLFISGSNIRPHFFRKFVLKCQNLTHLNVNSTSYEGRENITEAF